MNLLMIDTETTGIDPLKHRVLTLGSISVNYDDAHRLNVCGEQEWKITLEPNTPVSLEAIAVNKIDLAEHNAIALPEIEVIRDFVRFSSRFMNGKQFPVLLGWNLAFDVSFLKAAFARNGLHWPFYFIDFDVSSLWKMQKLFGENEPAFGGLKDAARVLLQKSVAHGALADAKLQLEVLEFYLKRTSF